MDTSGETASFGAAAADELREQLLAAGSAEIDGIGDTLGSALVGAGDVLTGSTGSGSGSKMCIRDR